MTRKLSKIAPPLAASILLAWPALAAVRQTVHEHGQEAVAKLHLQAVDRLPAAAKLHIAISLPFRNRPALGKLIQDIENPASGNFHHYLTPKEFNEKFGPSEADYQAVLNWARGHGMVVTQTHPGRSMLNVDGASSDVEKAFHVNMRVYRHPSEPRTFFAPNVEPSMDLGVPVLAIGGLNDFIKSKPRSYVTKVGTSVHRGGSDVADGGLYMGSDFTHAFAPDTNLNGSGQEVGILSYNGFTPADITAYEAKANLPSVPVQEVFVGVSGNNPDNGDAESALDIELAIAMAPGISQVVFYYGNDFDSNLTEMADPQFGEGLPLQLSSSRPSGTDAGTADCLARLAAQGQSFFYASGDSGAWPVEPNGPNGTYINGAYPERPPSVYDAGWWNKLEHDGKRGCLPIRSGMGSLGNNVEREWRTVRQRRRNPDYNSHPRLSTAGQYDSGGRIFNPARHT